MITHWMPTLIPAAVEAVTQLVQSLIDNIPLLIEAALQLVTGLAEGIIEAIPVLLEALPFKKSEDGLLHKDISTKE